MSEPQEIQLFCTVCGGARAYEVPDGTSTLLVCEDCGNTEWSNERRS